MASGVGSPRTARERLAGVLSALRTVNLLRLWRRSLALRAIGVSLVLGTLLLGALGSYVSDRIATQLVEERVRTAQAEAAAATREAQGLFNGTGSDEYEGLSGVGAQVVKRFESRAGETRNRLVILAPVGTATSADRTLREVDSRGANLAWVPDALRSAVQAQPERQHLMTTVYLTDRGERSAVISATRLRVAGGQDYDMYLIFPLDQEQRTLTDMQNSLLVASLGVLAVLVLVGFVVTRMIVGPLRIAARTSSALAAGDLDVRMPVRGEDDLARLGISFNTMADSLRAQIRKLENLSRVQQRFVSDVSHELRTPLTTIRMATEVIGAGRRDFPTPVARSAELLSQEVDRFEVLLSDLLEISRIDAGAAVLDRDSVDMVALVRSEVDAAAVLAEKVGTAVSFVALTTPLHAEVDARRISRVVRNLVVNAVEHAEGKPVEVTLAGDDVAVAVTVRDRGVGLSPEQVRMVFQRFWRADPARNRTSGGTGLGLAISKEDTQMHGGWLQCAGRPRAGAVFRLTLPRRAGAVLRSSPTAVPNLWPTDRVAAEEIDTLRVTGA